MRVFGHPVHAMLVAFPVALLALTPILGVIARLGIMAAAAAPAAYVCEIVGLGAGGLAIVTGFVDFMKIPQSAAAPAKTALIHASFALLAMSLFGVAFALRAGPLTVPSLVVLGLELAGAASIGATGWLGGHLVFHHRIGVRDSAE